MQRIIAEIYRENESHPVRSYVEELFETDISSKNLRIDDENTRIGKILDAAVTMNTDMKPATPA